MAAAGDVDIALRRVTAIAVLAAAAGVVLMAVRTHYAVSFATPLQLYTSGGEHGPLFALWRQIHGEPVYLDPHRIPFAPSYYNWLFFELYGWVVGASLHVLGLGAAWIPTAARLLTLLFAAVGVVVCYRTFVAFAAPVTATRHALAASFALFVFLGPFAGFWAITLHPELPAAVLLALSVYRFCRHYPGHPIRAVVEFALLSYAAWGFKQLYVYGPGAVGLYLLLRRDWRSLAVLTIVLPALWAATLALGSADYLKVILFRDTYVAFSGALFAHNLGNAMIKAAPTVLGLAALGLVLLRSPPARAAFRTVPHVGVFALGLAVSAVIVAPTSAKIGAAENYYFPLVYFGTGLVYAGLIACGRSPGGRSIVLATGVGWLGSLAMVVAVLGGLVGVLSTRSMDVRYRAIARCLEQLPAPAFTTAKYAMLPWMHPGKEDYVLSFEYLHDRSAGRSFEAGGIGGLITAGHFAALLLSPSESGFDGASMARYRLLPQHCVGLDIWLRRDLPVPLIGPTAR